MKRSTKIIIVVVIIVIVISVVGYFIYKKKSKPKTGVAPEAEPVTSKAVQETVQEVATA